MKKEHTCTLCKKSFFAQSCKKRKFCGIKCVNIWKRESGIRPPSRKGYKYTEQERHARKDQYQKMRMDGNWMWKGNKAKSGTMHDWLYRNYGKPRECQNKICISKKLGIHPTRIEYARLHGKKHKQDITHYAQLCVRCHRNYDLSSKPIKI